MVNIRIIRSGLEYGCYCRVYRNLRHSCYSIQRHILGRWLVVAHADRLMLTNVSFKVSEAGRNRVLKTRQKNVHSYAYGFFSESGMGVSAFDPPTVGNLLPAKITYSPYQHNRFFCQNLTDDSFDVEGARFVKFDESGLTGSHLIRLN